MSRFQASTLAQQLSIVGAAVKTTSLKCAPETFVMKGLKTVLSATVYAEINLFELQTVKYSRMKLLQQKLWEYQKPQLTQASKIVF